LKTRTKSKANSRSRYLLLLLLLFSALSDSNLIAAPAAASNPERTQPKVKSRSEGLAAWYEVPPNSLARRRAKPAELTAAHNRLPLGTLVRVTRLSNGRSVLVRITDRGITNRRANIDICKEAAGQLGMLREGFTRVRLEIVPEPISPSASDPNQIAAH
jgi:rare lipoprotein A